MSTNMVVTDIVELDKKRVVIYIDGQKYCALYKGEVRRYHLQQEADLSVEIAGQLHVLLQKRSRERALHLLERKNYTQKEIREKLKKSLYPEDIIADTLEFLQKYQYLDDLQFALDYIDYHSRKKSISVIKQNLFLKGIDRDTIEQALSERTIDVEQAIRLSAGRKLEDYAQQSAEQQRKICQSLLRRGFSYEDIQRVLRNLD